MAKKDRVTDLVRVITHLDTLYQANEDCIHPDTGEFVSDGEYDMLRKELESLDPKNSIFIKPTASTLTISKAVEHKPAMVSIQKANHENYDKKVGLLFKWMRDMLAKAPKFIWDEPKRTIAEYNGKKFEYPSHFFSQTYKLDGLALALYYEQGKLVRAGLRSRDAITGEDVTAQVKYVQCVPETLPLPLTCSIRGEIVCLRSDFDKAQAARKADGEEPLANERACAVGGMHQKDPLKTKEFFLTFLAYSIENLDPAPYETEFERAMYANKNLGIRFVRTNHLKFEDLKVMEDIVGKSNGPDYRVDGVVISVNHLGFQEQLGRRGDPTTGNPVGKIAWKFAEETAAPVVTGYEWNTGRTGRVVPTMFFDAVTLGDTQVERCTLHNAGWMKRKRIDVGTRVKMLKSGNIIPKVIGIVDNPKDPVLPTKCPSCGGDLVLETTPATKTMPEVAELRCYNTECPAQFLNTMTFFLEKIGAKGLGEVRVNQLIQSGKVKCRSDFFSLDMDDCKASGMSDRQAMLCLGTIHLVTDADQMEDPDLLKLLETSTKTKKKLPFWKLFQSLGIPTAGESAGKNLIDHFKTFTALRKATVDEIEDVSGVGRKTAEIVQDFLQTHSNEIDRLLEHFELELPKTGKLNGQKFCLSGGLPPGKDYWQKAIEDQGGKCSGMSKKLNYLVAGAGSGDKSDLAKEYGVPIITVDQLQKILESSITLLAKNTYTSVT